MNEEKKHRVCPVERAGVLDFNFRKLLQNPRTILPPYMQEGMTALDVGCGPGFFTVAMARLVGKTGRVVAADLQQGMLDKARKKIADAGLADVVTFHLCRPDAIGLRETYDFILVFYMLHEVPDQARFLHEVRSLLKPGGKVLIVEPKFHVTQDDFLEAIGLMKQAGLTVLAEPRIRFSRTVVAGSLGVPQPGNRS